MGALGRYQRDPRAARQRLASLERHVAHTRFWRIEYIDRGEGPVVLVVASHRVLMEVRGEFSREHRPATVAVAA